MKLEAHSVLRFLIEIKARYRGLEEASEILKFNSFILSMRKMRS